MGGGGESDIYLPLYINTLEKVEALAISTNSHVSNYNHFFNFV